jgi:hypothetical protein
LKNKTKQKKNKHTKTHIGIKVEDTLPSPSKNTHPLQIFPFAPLITSLTTFSANVSVAIRCIPSSARPVARFVICFLAARCIDEDGSFGAAELRMLFVSTALVR